MVEGMDKAKKQMVIYLKQENTNGIMTLLDRGFPINEPLMDTSGTILMYCAANCKANTTL